MATTTQNREAKPDPFGEYVTWTENTPVTGPRMSIARLVATDTGYSLVDQRIFSPQWDENTEYAADFANATRFYEGGSWHAGGRYLKYQTTTTGLNYDIYLLDTLTGERRQLTTDIDYNESGDVAPDGRSVYFSSARGADRMDVFTALQRPSLLDVAAFPPQMARVSLWNNRRAMNEPWVMNLDDGQQLGGYSGGQPIIIDPDWTIRGWSWFPRLHPRPDQRAAASGHRDPRRAHHPVAIQHHQFPPTERPRPRSRRCTRIPRQSPSGRCRWRTTTR